MKAFLGTGNGVWEFDCHSRNCVARGLSGHRIWALHAIDTSVAPSVLAGSYGAGIFRSDDGGVTWEAANGGLTAGALRTIGPDPSRAGRLLAGTEPARGFHSADDGMSWEEFAGIHALDGVGEWYLPYSPRAGAIRNFAATKDGSLLASVEVGGLLHLPAGSESWHVIKVDPGPRVHDDIHQVLVDPHDDTLFVAMGGALVDRTHGQWSTQPRQIGGVAVSRDGGASWSKLLPHYTRAIHIPSRAQDWLIAGPARSTNQGGWIVGSTDRGAGWEPIDDGIETPMTDMVERFVESPDGMVWALCSGGRVYAAEPGEWRWRDPFDGATSELVVESISFIA